MEFVDHAFVFLDLLAENSIMIFEFLHEDFVSHILLSILIRGKLGGARGGPELSGRPDTRRVERGRTKLIVPVV